MNVKSMPLSRSEIMQRIRSKDTKPEIVVRSLIHKMGFRYRLHVKELPGQPDIVFPRFKKIIFVHGCFWHFHRNCIDGRVPKTNVEKWKEKLERNVNRDEKNLVLLKDAGWKYLIIWECEIEKNLNKIKKKIEKFLT